jgi:hypothetical protein
LLARLILKDFGNTRRLLAPRERGFLKGREAQHRDDPVFVMTSLISASGECRINTVNKQNYRSAYYRRMATSFVLPVPK